jgi:hypothetical protein
MTDTIADLSAALINGSLALKTEMADCYAELAEQLENFNNAEAAAIFVQLAQHQQRHIQRLQQLASEQPHDRIQPLTFNVDQESPADDINADSHYLMHPYHAVELALNVEQQTQHNLLARLGIIEEDNRCQPQQLEHARHIQLLQQLLSRQPQPDSNWDEDLDPPNIDD